MADPLEQAVVRTIPIDTSNWRPLLRAFFPFLIAIAALLAMPRDARAQLYVTQASASIGIVSEYDATTGKAINTNLITGLNSPSALAVSDTELFVATFEDNQVGKYNATTGTAINAHLITGLQGPFVGLALNTSGRRLFVANNGVAPGSGRTVGKYNATTGAAIDASFITGLNGPNGLAVMGPTPLFSDPALFVANSNFTSGIVGKYDAKTGIELNASFITRLHGPAGLALLGNTLFVANAISNTVDAYDATTGAVIVVNLITGLHSPAGLVVSRNTLFVANELSGTVGKYNATTGKAINANFITGLKAPIGIAVKRAK
jgi:DNA-binding beta-propeller fold protein YncE